MSPDQKPKLTLKELWERSIPYFIIVSVFMAIIFTHRVEKTWHTNEIESIVRTYNLQISHLDKELSSIPRGIDGGKFLDIRKLRVKRSEDPDISERAEYIRDGEFYALTTDDFWIYLIASPQDIYNYINGTLKELKSSSENNADISSPTVYLWKGKNTHHVIDNSSFKCLFPYISVEKFSIDDIYQLPFVLKRGDISTALLIDLLHNFFVMSNNNQDLKIEVKKVYQAKDVFYVYSTTALIDCQIDDIPYKQYYVHREYILIPTGDNIFKISTFVPSPEPFLRGNASSSVTIWLNNFSILSE